MFKRLFSKGNGDTPAAPSWPTPAALAMKRQIEALRAKEPLKGLLLASNALGGHLEPELKVGGRIHAESYLVAVGALAGYACQESVREAAASDGTEKEAFVVVETTDGKRYFFGDRLNGPLAEHETSIWSLTAGALQHVGKPLPDLAEAFKHVSESLGGAEFGIPRVPSEHQPHEMPIDYLKRIWPKLQPYLRHYCSSAADWPIVLALRSQQTILATKDILDPTVAARLVMESAISMSKVDFHAEAKA